LENRWYKFPGGQWSEGKMTDHGFDIAGVWVYYEWLCFLSFSPKPSPEG